MSRRKLALATVGAFLGTALVIGMASATTMHALTVDDLATQAEAVVVGRVASVSDVATVHEGRLEARVVTRIEIEESVAGRPVEAVIQVVERHGTLGPLRFVSDTALDLRRGQRVLLFLSRGPDGYRAVGAGQGAFEVSADRRRSADRVSRSRDLGVLIGDTKARGIDLDARPTLDTMRTAVRDARHARGLP